MNESQPSEISCKVTQKYNVLYSVYCIYMYIVVIMRLHRRFKV